MCIASVHDVQITNFLVREDYIYLLKYSSLPVDSERTLNH